MTAFRLEHFPQVCPVCLQHKPDNLLISLHTLDPTDGGKLWDVVEEFMYPVLPELEHCTPSGICKPCSIELNAFVAYRNRLKLLGKFVLSLAQLRNGKKNHLVQLFNDHQTELLMVLRELKITEREQLVVQELLAEFNPCSDGNKVEQAAKPDQDQEIVLDHFDVNPEGEFITVEDKPEFEKIVDISSDRLRKLKNESIGHVCKRCNQSFETRRDLAQHKRSTHRDHMCDTCGLAFDSKFVLENHRKRHETVRQYKCEYCPLEYYTKAEKLLHVRRLHLNAFEVSCPECALVFRTKQTLAQHMKTHTNQRTHTCNTCGFSFKSHTHLNRHTKELHQGVQYRCEHCDMSYRRKDKLRMHVEKMHNIQTYFVCDVCLQSYDTDEKLQEHKAHHEAPNDLQCGVCLGAYMTQNEYHNHLCITYRENYICCNRDFKYHYFYNKHTFLVHGVQTNVRVKPVDGLLLGQYRAKRKQAERCPKCEQEFSTRQQKKQHMESCDGLVQYDISTAQDADVLLTMNVVTEVE
ncbi:zinc finger protein 184-like [Anopheles maculipalpis]|uniref:zinc finger protein 184-like n=1 Tax=Anopheles maculipalpis TaxID=1496333 RepID=UPI002158B12D|nr:zinc finger protein 184-like [Anopheles maculipalpis]